MILQSSRRLSLKLSLLIAAATSTAGLCEERPFNAAGYQTVTLAEAGLSAMPAHPPSETATSPAYARSVRRGGKTVTIDGARASARPSATKPGGSVIDTAD